MLFRPWLINQNQQGFVQSTGFPIWWQLTCWVRCFVQQLTVLTSWAALAGKVTVPTVVLLMDVTDSGSGICCCSTHTSWHISSARTFARSQVRRCPTVSSSCELYHGISHQTLPMTEGVTQPDFSVFFVYFGTSTVDRRLYAIIICFWLIWNGTRLWNDLFCVSGTLNLNARLRLCLCQNSLHF